MKIHITYIIFFLLAIYGCYDKKQSNINQNGEVYDTVKKVVNKSHAKTIQSIRPNQYPDSSIEIVNCNGKIILPFLKPHLYLVLITNNNNESKITIQEYFLSNFKNSISTPETYYCSDLKVDSFINIENNQVLKGSVVNYQTKFNMVMEKDPVFDGLYLLNVEDGFYLVKNDGEADTVHIKNKEFRLHW